MKPAFCLSDVGRAHLMTKDRMWIRLIDLIPLAPGRLSHSGFSDILEDVVHFSTAQKAEGARQLLLLEDCHTRVFRLSPGMSLRMDPETARKR